MKVFNLSFECLILYCNFCRTKRVHIKLREESEWFENYKTLRFACAECGRISHIFEKNNKPDYEIENEL